MTTTANTQSPSSWWAALDTETLLSLLPQDAATVEELGVDVAEFNSMIVGVLRRVGVQDEIIRELASVAS